MSMTERSFLSLGAHGFHRIAYFEWGEPTNDRVVICVHGLTRCGRDFDFVAESLQDRYRVICPDLPGRGHSHWLAGHEGYRPPMYAADMTALIARAGVEQVDWIGTSLGGIVGMLLAAQPNTPIRKLVVNDVGAFVGRSALERIAAYLGKDPLFADLGEVEAYLRMVHATFGPLADEHWQHLSRHSIRHDAHARGLRLHYDPSLALPFREDLDSDIDLWPVWEKIACPVLILRGEESDILRADTAEQMLVRGPAAELIEFPEVGHAPMLMDRVQIEAVREWLSR